MKNLINLNNSSLVNITTKLINWITIVMFLWSMLFYIYPSFDVSAALHPQWRQQHGSAAFPGFGVACMQGQIAGAMNLPFAALFVYATWFNSNSDSKLFVFLRFCCSVVQTIQSLLLVILGVKHLIMKHNFDLKIKNEYNNYNYNSDEQQFWLDDERMFRDTLFMGVLSLLFALHSIQQYYRVSDILNEKEKEEIKVKNSKNKKQNIKKIE